MAAATWEKVCIGAFIVALTLARGRLPAKIELGDAVLLAAGLLLVQGLVRDLLRIRAARRSRNAQTHRVTCVCAESTLGVSLIATGALLVFVASPVMLHVPPFGWPVAAALVTSFGFATRHLVIDWRARRFRWEPNHAGVVTWKK